MTEYFDTLTQLIMVKIRLTRTGPRKKPFYRVVAIDERKKNGGQPLETKTDFNIGPIRGPKLHQRLANYFNMRDLLRFILEGILGEDNFEIKEKEDNGSVILEIIVKPEIAGLIIGKGGQTINSIQNVVRVRARKENSSVFLKISEA